MLEGEVKSRSRGWQTESDLEREFISHLLTLGYEHLNIENESDILVNLRTQIERLNSNKNVIFTDSEWQRFFRECICKLGETKLDKVKKIQRGTGQQSLVRDDGSSENIDLIDKNNFYNNKLQFINRYSTSETKGDVTILLNGLPMVHIELRQTGRDIESIFADAKEYNRKNFTGSLGFFDFCEIFVISNGVETKYYSSTVRSNFLQDKNSNTMDIISATSNNFMFTSYWSNEDNEAYKDLSDFSKNFFEKKNLLEMIINFSVLDAKGNLRIMRPYQVFATKKIINRIKNSTERGILGEKQSGGYIWHATGSGKTLTSFKASKLATLIKGIDKVLFVVDRKDLDHQTQHEYGNFENGSAQGIKNINSLRNTLCSQEQKIIITTIQKLSRYISKYKSQDAEILKKHTVLIFDECHRSQFGSMHKQIKSAFKNSHIFGFTGTPIFEGKGVETYTTGHYFGDQLHKYTLIDAIRDRNVLQFKVDYFDSGCPDFNNTARIANIVEYIIEKFDYKTLRPELSINIKEKRSRGYNSILCVDSIKTAKKYYEEFKRQLSKEEASHKKLIVSMIYSAQETKDQEDIEDENLLSPDIKGMDVNDLKFLEDVIKDYNETFGDDFSTKASGFNSYYQNLSKRTKEQEIDILIVVNMFLTGFDAPFLNTLWVDKNLEQHGLIQAFSRTNRICKNTKTFGNIVCFRNIEKKVDDAFRNYGGGDPKWIIFQNFIEKYEGYQDENGERHEGYRELAERLQGYRNEEGNVVIPATEEEEMKYADTFFKFIKVRNELKAYDEFEGKEIIDSESLQKFQSKYIDLKEKYKAMKEESKEDDSEVSHDFSRGIEFIKQVEITLEYIIDLIIRHTEWRNMDTEEKLRHFKEKINVMMDSTTYLRDKKDVINDFIDNESKKTDESFIRFMEQKLEEAIDELSSREGISKEATKKFIATAFRNNEFEEWGDSIDEVVPPSRLNPDASFAKQDRVRSFLRSLYDKFHGLIKNMDKWLR